MLNALMMVRTANFIIKIIERINRFVGIASSYAMPVIVLVTATVTVLRYAFQVGFPWLSEVYIWLNGATFMLAAAWVLASESHVRVDVWYRRLSEAGQAISNIFGTVVFLWPMMFVIFFYGYPGVIRSWKRLEGSPTADGLEILYLLKTTVLLFCVLVALQGVAIVLRSLLILTGSKSNEKKLLMNGDL